MCIRDRPKEISRAISDELKIGITILDGRGYYSNEEKTILYAVVNRFQTVKTKDLVKNIDPNAYIVITTVADLLHGSKEA